MELIRRSSKALDEDDLPEIECDTCSIKFSGVQPYENHLQGKKHKKMIMKLRTEKKLKGMSSSNAHGDNDSTDYDEALYEAVPHIKPYGRCSLCKKTFSGPEGQHQHLISAAHERKMAQMKIKERIGKLNSDLENHIVIYEEVDEEDPNHNYAECKACEKVFNNPISLTQHVKSSTHQRNVREHAAEKDMESYSLDPEEISSSLGFKYKCKTCNASFLNVSSLEKHLSSRLHARQKHKVDILDFLSNYPDLKQVPSANIVVSDHQSSDDEEAKYYPLENQSSLFICKICSCSFPGPESAKEHVLSKKHAKSRVFKETQMKMASNKAGKMNGIESIQQGNNAAPVLSDHEVPANNDDDDFVTSHSPTLPQSVDDFEIII